MGLRFHLGIILIKYALGMPTHSGLPLYCSWGDSILEELGLLDAIHMVLDFPRGYAVLEYRRSSKFLPATLVVTDNPSPYYIQDLIDKGPSSVLFNPEDEASLKRSLALVGAGKVVMEVPFDTYNGCEKLAPRERQVLHLVVEGYSNRDIAARLNIKPQTVHNMVYRLLDKLGLEHRCQIPLQYFGYLAGMYVVSVV